MLPRCQMLVLTRHWRTFDRRKLQLRAKTTSTPFVRSCRRFQAGSPTSTAPFDSTSPSGLSVKGRCAARNESNAALFPPEPDQGHAPTARLFVRATGRAAAASHTRTRRAPSHLQGRRLTACFCTQPEQGACDISRHHVRVLCVRLSHPRPPRRRTRAPSTGVATRLTHSFSSRVDWQTRQENRQ
jgi:hypothetical protein